MALKPMFRLLALTALSLCSLLTTGCLAAQTFTSARTLDQGKTEVTLVAAAAYTYTGSYYGQIPLPAFGAQVRHGLTDNLELGGTIGETGVAAQLKFGLLRSGTPDGGVSLAVAPAVGGLPRALSQGDQVSVHFNAELPLLLGVHLGGGHELTLAPLARWTYGAQGHFVAAGGTVGVALRLSDLFVLTPELGVMAPVAGAHPYGSNGGFSSLVPSFGLGMTWGR